MNDSTPFTPRPPRRWELFTFTPLVLVAASALLSLIATVSYLGVYRAVSSDGVSGISILVEFTLRHGHGFDRLYLVLVFAYLAAQIVWRRQTTSMLATFRGRRRRLARRRCSARGPQLNAPKRSG
jgi:hypothetical protein